MKLEPARLYSLKYGVYRRTQQVLEAGSWVVVLRFKMCMARVAPVPGGTEKALWVKTADLERAVGGEV